MGKILYQLCRVHRFAALLSGRWKIKADGELKALIIRMGFYMTGSTVHCSDMLFFHVRIPALSIIAMDSAETVQGLDHPRPVPELLEHRS